MKLDQFYTKPSVAIDCYNKLLENINIDNFDIIFEPSAGTGSFYCLLPINKRVGIDLDPKGDGIMKKDLFKYIPIKNKKYCVVGNPPFGKSCSTAVKFFNHLSEYADVIAFIIPRTFKRLSIQNRLSMKFHLIHTNDIPVKPCAFEPSTEIKCCFQIWKKTPVLRLKIIHDINHDDFTFLKLNCDKKIVDIAFRSGGSNIGKIVTKDIDNLVGNLWIYLISKIDINLLIDRFSKLDYSMALDTVARPNIGQKDLIFLYRSMYG